MLFNSYVFVLGFLPLTVIGFYLLGSHGRREAALAWLVACSLFYYAWWKPAFVALILVSIAFNFALGGALSRRFPAAPRALLAAGVAANLAALGYFKYANFFVDNVNALSGAGITLEAIVLPIGISFFTFQQIAYLVDAYRGETREHGFLHYCLFVSFFPQLIAGPIVHHKEMLPQFARPGVYRLDAARISVGLTIFVFGMFKKVMIADQIAPYATRVFDAVERGLSPDMFEAWGGALAYTFQIYFDFSGYSDMAIGLAFLFGIRLPLNFDSPYKAASIIDFWRRWHMTLSRFLRDYLYIPLGGNRRGPARRYINLMATMVLGGLWHGAGWTFLAWGALHGLYLVMNHGWRRLRRGLGLRHGQWGMPGQSLGVAVTFLAVVVAWVFFRAESFAGALAMLKGMAGLNGVATDTGTLFGASKQAGAALTFLALLAVVWLLPNTQQIMAARRPTLTPPVPALASVSGTVIAWRADAMWALATAGLAFLSLVYMSRASAFLYYQF